MMSRVQPPGLPVPLSQPFVLAKACAGVAGHVVSIGPMYWSMLNGLFPKMLLNDVPFAESAHGPAFGDRLTSSCSRQAYGVPSCLTCTVWAGSALSMPLTPSHKP